MSSEGRRLLCRPVISHVEKCHVPPSTPSPAAPLASPPHTHPLSPPLTGGNAATAILRLCVKPVSGEQSRGLHYTHTHTHTGVLRRLYLISIKKYNTKTILKELPTQYMIMFHHK